MKRAAELSRTPASRRAAALCLPSRTECLVARVADANRASSFLSEDDPAQLLAEASKSLIAFSRR